MLSAIATHIGRRLRALMWNLPVADASKDLQFMSSQGIVKLEKSSAAGGV